jgi:RimJ/RimL family protein N-acetyltransferase
MMDLEKPLFIAERICFAPVDFEKDPEIFARWTQDAAYARMLSTEAMRPLPAWAVKKNLEAQEKRIEEEKNEFFFTIRLREDSRLIGSASIHWIDWTNSNAYLTLGIGEAECRGQGLGREALGLMLRFAFRELNLYRLTAVVPEYNQPALRLFTRAGFGQEVRRRQALERDGRTWDLLHLGLLSEEWTP